MGLTTGQRLDELASQIDSLWAGMNGIAVGPQGISNMMIQPKAVSAGNISVQSLQAVNTKTGALSVTGGITMATSGSFSSGQSAYNTGTGFWLEYNGGTPRMSLGNSAGNHLTWDGSALAITGSLTATTGTIGGWTIGSTTLTGGHVTLDSGGAITLNSSGTYGDVFKLRNAGSDAGSLWANSTGVVLQQGPASPGTGASLSLQSTGYQLYHNNGSIGTGAAALIASFGTSGPALWLTSGNVAQVKNQAGNTTTLTDAIGNLTVYGRVYPSNQASRYIYDDGVRTAFSNGIALGGDLKLGAGSTGTTGSGALPSPTKYVVLVTSGGLTYFVPAYSAVSPWTA